MKCALVIVEIPEKTWREDTNAPTNFANQFLGSLQSKELVQAISPCAYLCFLEQGLHDLAILVGIAKGRGLKTRTLFFDQDPSWVFS